MTCKANVDVVLTPDTTKDPVKWTMENCISNQKGGYGSYPVVQIPKSANPTDAHLVYLIENPSGSTWKFAKDTAALWVTSGGQDPKQPSTDPHIPVGTIHTSNPNPANPATADTQLSFTDHNGPDPVMLHYTLNFVNGQKSSSTLDPIIDNGGCCQVAGGFWSETGALFANSTFDAWVAIAFFLGVLATLGARKLTGRRSNPSDIRTGSR